MSRKITKREDDAPEVIATSLAPIPRPQARLLEFFRRTPGTAHRFQLLEEANQRVHLALSREDALAYGKPELLAEIVYEQAMSAATANERETRFSATWYDEDGRVVVHHPMRLGASLNTSDSFDGTSTAIIIQMQRHVESLVAAVTSSQASMAKGYQQLLDAQQDAANAAARERDTLRAALEQAREERDRALEIAEKSSLEEESKPQDELLDRVIAIATAAIAESGKAKVGDA